MSKENQLLIGLGNPGDKYLMTRHNIGFLAIDWVHKAFSGSPFKSEHKSEVASIMYEGQKIFLCKPQTFMNLSGEAVQSLMAYYKIKKENILVLHDDLAMPFGALRFMENRSPGGHNGIKDIHQKIGPEYSRLKIGISRENIKMPVDRFVLQNFSKEETELLPELLEDCLKASLCFFGQGLTKASNSFNRKNSLIKETEET